MPVSPWYAYRRSLLSPPHRSLYSGLAALLGFFFRKPIAGTARARSGDGAANAKRGEGRSGVQAEREDHRLCGDQYEGMYIRMFAVLSITQDLLRSRRWAAR